MRKTNALFVVFIILLVGIFSYTRITSPHTPAISTSTPTPLVSMYCAPRDLSTDLSLSPGAGNIYGTVTIKNISDRSCQMIINKKITVSYDKTIKNISVDYVGQPEKDSVLLVPGEALFSQVHYPNGPQCQSGTQTTSVIFSYAISPTDTIIFPSQQGSGSQSVITCISPSEITTIQVWNISLHPITR